MEEKKPYLYLNAFLAKDEHHASLPVSNFLKSSSQVNTYDLDRQYELEGKLFVKIPTEKSPNGVFLQKQLQALHSMN